MRYRLHKLIGGPVGKTHVEHLDRGPTKFDDDLQVNTLRGTLTFTRLNRAIMVSGDLETEVTVQDARTLEDFGLCLRVTLDDILFSPPGEFDLATDEPDRQVSDDGWIDLTETIREEIIMAIPINPINPARAGAEDALVSDVLQENDDWLSVKWNNPNEGK
jgi:uncharacterized metal-binding protein YceD (DUF177 family)